MTDPREQKFQQLAQQFPDAPMAHYSLGRLYCEQRRWAEAVPPLERACTLDTAYAAALVCLGDAYAGAGRTEEARRTYEGAKEVALQQKHEGLAQDIQDKLDFL
ncbi:MAG: tetratricopeptide repeat protein [Deltaproteobacteria bacterium]|nr:tetratricopeptide repeat protein [Deltaproteobacteria bacterium]